MILKRKIDLLLAKSNGAQLMWLLGLSGASLAIAIVVAQWVFNDGTIVWQDVVAVFLDPGCFGGAGAHDWFRLILALLRPQEGEISLYHADGDGQQLSPRMRCNFVYVPQGNTLMSGTIRDNLLMGSPTATDDEMYDALHQACADFVSQLPDGLDTRCSESGAGLSEGQAQRIAIARALLRNRPVMLFDEATSALDIETERRLLANVLGSRQHTIIFITHRPAVVEYCDEVLRL